MPILFGIVVGFFVFTYIWAFVGPFVALLNLMVGRFFIAAVLMALSLYSGTLVWDDFHVEKEHYTTLLILGLILEIIKWGRQFEWGKRGRRFNREVEVPIEVSWPEIVINVVDNDSRPMKDVTPKNRTRYLSVGRVDR